MKVPQNDKGTKKKRLKTQLMIILIFQHNFKDHVTFMGAMKNHGLAVIDFKRSIMPHDSVDAPIPMEGPVQVLDNQLF